jgi:hypothetical protein
MPRTCCRLNVKRICTNLSLAQDLPRCTSAAEPKSFFARATRNQSTKPAASLSPNHQNWVYPSFSSSAREVCNSNLFRLPSRPIYRAFRSEESGQRWPFFFFKRPQGGQTKDCAVPGRREKMQMLCRNVGLYTATDVALSGRRACGVKGAGSSCAEDVEMSSQCVLLLVC